MTLSADEIAVFCGLDVGKGEHHATALNPAGKRLHDKKLANSEPDLRELFTSLTEHGPVLIMVDQPASIGALPVAVARDAGCQVAYLPGLTMRRPICTPARARPTRGTPTLSPTPGAPCRIPCAPSTPMTRPWPS